MKTPQYNTTDIASLSHEGRGIAFIEGKTTFIEGALPNETVRFQYKKCRGRFDEGIVEDIITPSPIRVEPRCPHFNICGGCTLQHADSQWQIEAKQTILSEQLQHIAGTKPLQWLTPLTGPVWGYRHKARLGVRYVKKKDKVLVGFREKHYPRFLADIDRCEVLHPSVGQLITPLKQLVESLSIKTAVAQIEVAVADNVSALIFRHLKAFTEADTQTLIDFAKAHSIALYLQPKGPKTIHCLWSPIDTELQYQIPDYDLTMRFGPSDVTQVNLDINNAMIRQAIEYLQLNQSDQVLDLFCGLGNFSLPMARFAKHVVGIEGDDAMVQRATDNAMRNDINNAQFYSANLFESIAHLDLDLSPFNKLLLDPPRSGAETIVENIEQIQPERIVYVSCNPATLARDCKTLISKGYQLSHAGVMDMFPHTSHIEAMAVFEVCYT